MKIKWKIFLGVAFISSVGHAQEKRTLTLQEAINLAVQNSGQLKISQAKIDEAAAAVKEAVERRLPDANISGSYLLLNNPNINLKTKPSSGGSTGSSQPAHPSSAAYTMANVSLPVYAGSKIRYGIESAKLLEKAVRLDAENDMSSVILNTIDAYNNLYKSGVVVNLAAENLKSAKERVTELTSLEKNGIIPRNDLMKAQLQASNAEIATLDAENNWQLANISMDLLLGLPEKTELAIDSSFKQTSAVQNLEDYTRAALKNRKDLEALGFRAQAAGTAVKATAAEKFPSVAISAGYVAADIPHVLTVTNAINIGLGIQYNISSLWKNKSKLQQAQARQKQIAAGEGILSDAIRLEVSRAYYNYLAASRKIGVNRIAVEQASENFRIIKNKHANSLATTTELLDADTALYQARVNLAFSESDAVVAYNKLLEASGSLTRENQ
jgi:outer membrane protein